METATALTADAPTGQASDKSFNIDRQGNNRIQLFGQTCQRLPQGIGLRDRPGETIKNKSRMAISLL
jgi:hypothetical protein